MSDRDANGRFVNGHAKTGGRSTKEREERYFEIAKTTISFDRFERIIDKLGTMAEKGNLGAAKLLLEYLIGSPKQSVDITSKGESISPEILPPSEIAARVAALKAVMDEQK
jgi:hypothetical protein